jgi:hypothetical protein
MQQLGMVCPNILKDVLKRAARRTVDAWFKPARKKMCVEATLESVSWCDSSAVCTWQLQGYF